MFLVALFFIVLTNLSFYQFFLKMFSCSTDLFSLSVFFFLVRRLLVIQLVPRALSTTLSYDTVLILFSHAERETASVEARNTAEGEADMYNENCNKFQCFFDNESTFRK